MQSTERESETVRRTSIFRDLNAAVRLATICLPVCLAGARATAEPPMLHGSFLKRHVHSPRELKRQVAADSRISKRYVKVLNMSDSQVRAMVNDLHVTTLPRGTYMKVWFVKPTSQGEEMHYRLQYQKAGTRVYTASDGRPIMLEKCGNLVLQSSTATAFSTAPPVPIGYAGKPISPQILATPLFATLPTALPGSFMATRAPAILGAGPLLPTQGLVPLAAAGFPFAWLSPLGLLPLLAVGGGSSSGGSPLVPPTEAASASQTPIYPSPTPVPEPGALTLMAGATTGGLGLVCLRKLRS